MRPNRSVEMPPDKSRCGAEPRRADGDVEARTATTGTMASRPSVDFTGRKSIKASPQLNSMVSIFRQDRRSDVTPRIASRLSRSSWRISPWTRRFERWKSAIPGAVGSLSQPIADIEAMASPIVR